MKLLSSLFVMTVLFSSTVMAGSYYSKIENWHKNGTNVSIESIAQSAWVGRCFDQKDPDTALASLVVIDHKELNAGPISAYFVATVMMHFDSSEAKYFDGHSQKTLQRMAGYERPFYVTASSRGTVKITGNNLLGSFKGHDSYLVLKLGNTIGSISSSWACYYFVPGAN